MKKREVTRRVFLKGIWWVLVGGVLIPETVASGWNPYTAHVSSGGWLPTSIGGCVFWARSDLGAWQDAEKTVPCTADSLIWTGEDQVGVGGNDLVQATESKRFVYKENILDGHPAWRADGIDDLMNVSGSLKSLVAYEDAPVSVFIVYRISTTDAADRHFLCWSNIFPNYYYALRYTSQYHFLKWCTVQKYFGGGTVDTNPHYAIFTDTGILGNAWVDGSQIITNVDLDIGLVESYPEADRFSLASYAWTESTFFGGDYFDIAIYDNEISSASRALLNAYAAARYPSI